MTSSSQYFITLKLIQYIIISLHVGTFEKGGARHEKASFSRSSE